MKNFPKLIILILTFVFSFSIYIPGAMAQSDENEKLNKALAKYNKIDNVKNCILVNRIRQSTVIDNKHILFRLRGGDVYLNTLPRKCSGLGFYKAFSYKTSTNELCNVDIITVVEADGQMRGTSCGLGQFQQYKKIVAN